MPICIGDKLGPYEILAPIGAGGMGEVYKARDKRLDRIVAIKLSKTEFSERFELEARAVAALNHPNICQLYDVGPNYLVMEYIEGPALKGPLPLDQALKYAAQICDALDAAQKKNITHRDLKPANILVTKAGVKLLDFGLAKIGPAVMEDEATMITALTGKNEIVGTPAYMAPEQRKGKRADARSDIYSFGCVLYEMLTGKRAAANRVPVAPPLEAVLRTCLEEDPDERWQSARELKHALRWAAEAKPATSAPSRPRFGKAGWIAAAVFALIAATVSFPHLLEKPAGTAMVRFTIAPPEKTSFSFGPGAGPDGFPALSPDGRRLVFGAQPTGGSARLWVRSLDATTSQPLAGTEGASLPFWSPDGHSIGFGANGKLKKVDLSGGPPVSLADAPSLRGASWSAEGVILFTPTRTS